MSRNAANVLPKLKRGPFDPSHIKLYSSKGRGSQSYQAITDVITICFLLVHGSTAGQKTRSMCPPKTTLSAVQLGLGAITSVTLQIKQQRQSFPSKVTICHAFYFRNVMHLRVTAYLTRKKKVKSGKKKELILIISADRALKTFLPL